MKFKIGDIVTGISKEVQAYGITTDKAIMEVMQIVGKNMSVKVLDHESKRHIGQAHMVEQKYFKKVDNFLTKDKPMNNNQPVYWECKVNGHNKFWAAHIILEKDGKYTLVRKWGKIGTTPQTMEQVFVNKWTADEALRKLIWEKEQKDYKPIF